MKNTIIKFLTWITPLVKLTATRLSCVSKRSIIVDTFLARMTVPFIISYQKLISPQKGFKCAYAASTGGLSCSGVALNAFETTTFSSSVEIVDTQFNKCYRTYISNYSDLIDQAIINIPNFSDTSDIVIYTCCHADETIMEP